MSRKKSAEADGKLSGHLSLLDPEDGGYMFFRNTELPPNFTALQPRIPAANSLHTPS
jgi:hypothetical protein